MAGSPERQTIFKASYKRFDAFGVSVLQAREGLILGMKRAHVEPPAKDKIQITTLVMGAGYLKGDLI